MYPIPEYMRDKITFYASKMALETFLKKWGTFIQHPEFQTFYNAIQARFIRVSESSGSEVSVSCG